MPISNSSYNSILREYEEIQSKHRSERRKRQREVYEKIPQMEELDQAPGKLALARYRQSLRTGTKSLVGLSAEIARITREKQRLLKENGFAPDYLDMHYTCPDCKDTGQIGGERCHCFKQKILRLLYSQSNLSGILERENFSKFSFDYYDDKKILPQVGMTNARYMEKVVNYCKNFIENFAREKDSIIFTGSTGVGKTFLANCIAKELLDRYYSVVYMTANELFEVMGRGKLEQDPVYGELRDYVLNCDLLVLDDLGTELMNSFTTSEFFHIINRRMNLDMSTIISTNLSMEKLRDIYTERITSRLQKSYTLISFYGEDIRADARLG